jgi:hypothetical protein
VAQAAADDLPVGEAQRIMDAPHPLYNSVFKPQIHALSLSKIAFDECFKVLLAVSGMTSNLHIGDLHGLGIPPMG